jgi:hypothetical protein
MARKLGTVNKGRTAPTKAVKTHSGGGGFDWDSYTGKLGTVKGTWKAGSPRMKLFKSILGSGGPYVLCHLDPDDDRISDINAGITLTADDMTVRETKNGKVYLDAELFPSENQEDRDVEVLSLGGFVTLENAAAFVSVTVTAQ